MSHAQTLRAQQRPPLAGLAGAQPAQAPAVACGVAQYALGMLDLWRERMQMVGLLRRCRMDVTEPALARSMWFGADAVQDELRRDFEPVIVYGGGLLLLVEPV